MLFIRQTLYALKRQYGAEVALYKTTTTEIDSKTGKKSTIRTKVVLDLAIVLPDSLANKFAYEHSFLAANRKFTYGAQWDQRQRLIIVDAVDLPEAYKIESEDSIVVDQDRYVVAKAEQFADGYLLTVVRAENNLPLLITDLSVTQSLGVGQSAGSV